MNKSVDCIIISTGRAASTAIYRYLDMAGSLNLPENKEPHYWCDLSNYQGLTDLVQRIHVSEERNYFDLYKRSKIVLDASCGYFFCLDKVIESLKRRSKREEMPKIIYLYREPVGRAISWYNERRRKNLTQAGEFFEDLQKASGFASDLWWENCYDNIFYDANFRLVEKNFDEVFALNYQYFAEQPINVIDDLLRFLKIAPTNLDNLVCDPINSTQEALARTILSKHTYLQDIGGHLPPKLKRWLSRQLVHYRGAHLKKKQSDKYSRETDIASLLPVSVAEYRKFRERIGHQDLYVFG